MSLLVADGTLAVFELAERSQDLLEAELVLRMAFTERRYRSDLGEDCNLVALFD